MPFVVDASAAAGWFFTDEATPQSEALLAATADDEVWVPALWLLEIGNMLLSAERRGRIPGAQRRALIVQATALRLRVDREPVPMTEIDALAAQHGLTAYDAAYLELALRRGLSLATLDAALLAAMSAAGVAAPELES